MEHRAGFVNIIGSPNVGKSTLMNALIGEKLSIVTSKAQTTRHRILGIVNEESYQIVFSDTPGVVNASYKLHESMMQSVNTSLSDADIVILMTDTLEQNLNHLQTLEKIKLLSVPILCLINKVDKSSQDIVDDRILFWKEKLPEARVFPISALHKFNLETVWNLILELLPVSPPYYDKEEISDRPMRFFVSEIIREKIFLHCKKEVPYSCQVEIESYIQEEKMIRIRAIIIVERDSQRGIIIGKGGTMLKRIGREARIEVEKFTNSKVFLENYVKVDSNWRSLESKLKKYGY